MRERLEGAGALLGSFRPRTCSCAGGGGRVPDAAVGGYWATLPARWRAVKLGVAV